MKPPHAKRSKKDGRVASKNGKKEDLIDHIRALGGDVEKDFELLKDADSDALEDTQSSPADVSATMSCNATCLSVAAAQNHKGCC